MAEALFAAFATKGNAERATGALLDHGLKDEDISLVSGGFKDEASARLYTSRFTIPSAEVEEDHDDSLSAKTGISVTTAGDAGVGAAVGAGIGAGLGALAALGSLFVPGVGLVTGGGALAIALAGTAGSAAAGAVAGGATGYLVDLGVDRDTADEFEQTVQSGGAALAVHLPTDGMDPVEAREILNKYHATCVVAGVPAA